jgi:hypothetical protein
MIDLNSDEYKPKNWGILYYFENDIDNLIIAENKIIANSETYSKKLIEEFRTKVRNDSELQTKPTNYEEGSYQSQYYQHFYEDSERIIKQILQNHRKASLLSVFSILEGQLKLISNLIEDEFNFDIKLKNLNGSDYIHRYWLFLTKVFKMHSMDIEKDYNSIRQHKYIRNKIAHNNSVIEKRKLQFVKETKGLRIRKFGEDNIVEIKNDKYISDILNSIRMFFNKLTKEIDNRYGEIKNIG